MSQSPELDRLVAYIDIRLEKIEEEIAKLRKAIIEGHYDSRSLAGDVVLIVESQLKQLRKEIPKSKP